MSTIKSYTDLEQSKKLAKILSIGSADMHYGEYCVNGENYPIPNCDDDYNGQCCWSLAALRNILPIGIKIDENTYLFESHNTFDKCWVYKYYNENNTSYLYYKNINEVDACYEMIIKLHELNLL